MYNESLIEFIYHPKKRMIIGIRFFLNKNIRFGLHGIQFLHAEIFYLLHALKFAKRLILRDYSNLHKEAEIKREHAKK